MIFEKATSDDINELVTLRIAYLEEDSGAMEKDVLASVRNELPKYFERHLNDDITAYVARSEQEIAACAFLLVTQKPMSPAFINGKTGSVLNVYTRPEHRHKGYAKRLMKMLLDDAAEKELSTIELKATDDGYHLYRSVGFEDDMTKYHLMKWRNADVDRL